jgi:hypothetical protein
MSASLATCTLLALSLMASPAHAGDPTAHTGAMVKAANVVGLADEFKNGVGAPLLNGVPQVGEFFIRTDGRDDCPYESSNGFGDGCAYISINGLAINEPDDWACLDDRQPPKMKLANAHVAPVSSVVATALKSIGIHQVAMVCNWNHFDSNPAMSSPDNRDANAAHELVMEWAEQIPAQLESRGAGDGIACDSKTWETYYARIGNALHYTQDQASEHHAEGNLVCGNTTFASQLHLNPLHRFSDNRRCMRWLTDTLEEVTRNNSTYTCDDQVVAPLDPAHPTRRELNTTMLFLAVACGLDNGIISRSPVVCMGLERTLRHHCRLDRDKTIECAGPPSDNQTAVDEYQYCEGELYARHGGEDFIAKAVAASVPVIEKAARRWAEVCKQPDDPCDPAQCTNWCQRTVGAVTDEGEAITGYCMNSGEGDARCVLHECLCAWESQCGLTSMPCCKSDTPCQSADDECGPATGRCLPKGTDICETEFDIELVTLPTSVPTGTSLGVTARLTPGTGGATIPADSQVTWSWQHSGAGSLELVDRSKRTDNTQRFHTGESAGTAEFSVSATVVAPNRAPVRVLPKSRTLEVKDGTRQIVLRPGGGTFPCSDPLACGVDRYHAYLVPRFEDAIDYTAVFSGFGYATCNRTVSWTQPVGDGGDCNFPITYHPHSSAGPSDTWALWMGWGEGPFAPDGICEVTITLAPE